MKSDGMRYAAPLLQRFGNVQGVHTGQTTKGVARKDAKPRSGGNQHLAVGAHLGRLHTRDDERIAAVINAALQKETLDAAPLERPCHGQPIQAFSKPPYTGGFSYSDYNHIARLLPNLQRFFVYGESAR